MLSLPNHQSKHEPPKAKEHLVKKNINQKGADPKSMRYTMAPMGKNQIK